MGNDFQNTPVQEPVAIIGMGCRFPGANNPHALWELIANGRIAVTEVPPDRWDIDFFYNPDRSAKGKINSRVGGFLSGYDQFDPFFFDMSPREAPHVDPRQRLILETSWEALEDAGIPPDSLSGSKTGVFMAVLTEDYAARLYDDFDIIEIYTGTGSANTTVPNRVSYFLNLHGPSLAVDTACSGSLMAIHLACQSLHNGECNLALAGGVSVILEPYTHIFMAKAGALSPDEYCRAFDKDANGFIRSEGVGVLVLKPLKQAIADGNRVWAVVLGSAVNHCGRSDGIMAPNGKAQEMVLRAAYQHAGISPQQIQYIEAHGTGTKMGDPIEANALGSVLGPDYPSDSYCALGSIKTNIGHGEASAGVAGVIKTVMAIQHRLLPPSLNFKNPNPLIPFDSLPIRIQRNLGAWPRPSERLIAGVSGFGFTGANAHVVLAEPCPQAAPPAEQAQTQPASLLPISAKSQEALRAMAETYRDWLKQETQPIRSLCFTAGAGRTHFNHRIAVVGKSPQDLAGQLNAYLEGNDSPGVLSGSLLPGKPAQVIFVFSGQGSHWKGMGLSLMQQEAVFSAKLQECDRLFQAMAGWSLLEELTADESNSRLNSTEITQPAIFSMQVALDALWRSWGVTPTMIVGHSLGEAAAAYAAGALTLEEAASVVYHRSRLIKRVEGKGRMAVVGLSRKEANLAVAISSDLVSVAGSNSPSSSLLSGDPDTLERIVKSLDNQGIFCRMVKDVSFAPHSPHMDALRGELVESLRHLKPRPGITPILSTVTGALIDGTELDADYWGRNLREPFLFTDVVQKLVQSGYTTFVEVSPHPVLVAPIIQGLEAAGKKGIALHSLRRNEPEFEAILLSLGRLYTLGSPLDWRQLYPHEPYASGLPTYQWQRERYWVDQLTNKTLGWRALISGRDAKGGVKTAGRHPLLGEHVKVSLSPWPHVWEMDIDLHSPEYLADHRIQGLVIVPAAFYIEMGLAAAAQAWGEGAYQVDQLEIKEVFVVPETDRQRLQVVLLPDSQGEATFQVCSESGQEWRVHASGRVRPLNQPATPPASEALNVIQARCAGRLDSAQHYAAMLARGLAYGPAFQAVRQIWRRKDEVLCQLELPAALTANAGVYHIHPVLLDACIQSVSLGDTENKDAKCTFLPAGLGSVQLYRQPGNELWCHTVVSQSEGSMRMADLTLMDNSGQVVAVASGVQLAYTGSRDYLDSWAYEIEWQAQPPAPADQTQRQQAGSWIIFAHETDSDAVSTLLVARGEECVLVHPGQAYHSNEGCTRFWINPHSPADYGRLFKEALSPGRPLCRGIIHRWSESQTATQSLTGEALKTAQTLGPNSLVYLAQTLTRLGIKPRPWIVTRAAQPVLPTDVVAPAQTMLWGIGRVLGNEQPELYWSLLDLPQAEASDEADWLLAEIWLESRENQVALRHGARYVPRLKRYEPARPTDGPARPTTLVRDDGTYLITGGLGGLGLVAAHWLADQGARSLVLTSRRDRDNITPKEADAVQALEAAGVQVDVAQGDVADGQAMARLMSKIAETKPLRGIIHAAGLVDDVIVSQMTAEKMYRVMAPKIQGAWNLHQLTENLQLDWLVLFSSLSSVIGATGQVNYASGNAFMDGLAYYRRKHGLPALSINWGPWAEVGMAAVRDEMVDYQSTRGMPFIGIHEGMDMLAKLLTENPIQVTSAHFNWAVTAQMWPINYRPPMWEDICQAEAGVSVKTEESASTFLKDVLLPAQPEERRRLLESFLQKTVASVMHIDPSRLDIHTPFSALGIDSIMALELRNRVNDSIQQEVSIADLLRDLSVASLADRFMAEHKLQEQDEDMADLLAEIEQLSESEVEALLND